MSDSHTVKEKIDLDTQSAPVKVVLGVPTCIQMYSWDCGLACACMVLKYVGLDEKSVYTTDLEDLKCGESIWTIDLAYLLKRHGLQVELATVTIGVDKSYAKKSFYEDNFDKDEKRVENLFSEASSADIVVKKRAVKMEEIIQHVARGNLVISLVDWSFLQCMLCDKVGSTCFSCFSTCCSDYQGHYIVVCGYDSRKKRIYYKNPSYNQDFCCISISRFDKARKSHGTDEDTLFIFTNNAGIRRPAEASCIDPS